MPAIDDGDEHGFYNENGQIQPIIMPVIQKSKGILFGGKPLPLADISWYYLPLPTITLYESLADGEDELGDEGGAQSPPQGINKRIASSKAAKRADVPCRKEER